MADQPQGGLGGPAPGGGAPPPPGDRRDAEATLGDRRDGEATLGDRQDAEATLRKRQGFYLPHWTKAGAVYHSVFRLADSLPQSVLEQWIAERDLLLKIAKKNPDGLNDHDLRRLHHLVSERTEEYLDSGHGSCLMKDPVLAKIVADALRHFDSQRYQLHAWCVMPNHVHTVVEPWSGFELSEILHSWKSFTAHEINKAREGSGTLWQKEPYDHIIRDEASYHRVVQYVLENPKAAGLKSWPWVGRGGFGVTPDRAFPM